MLPLLQITMVFFTGSARKFYGSLALVFFSFLQIIHFRAYTGCHIFYHPPYDDGQQSQMSNFMIHDLTTSHNTKRMAAAAAAEPSQQRQLRSDQRIVAEPVDESRVWLFPQRQEVQQRQQHSHEHDHTNRYLTSDLSELSKDAFAGCLMIMDGNHFLVEWLAYHWYTLPLKHLTVYIDSKSRTDPKPILDRWMRTSTSNNDPLDPHMQIEIVDWEWPGIVAPVPEYLQNETLIRNYIGRQNMFYGDCMKQYARRNWKSWVILTDVDEFIGVNRWVNGQTHPLNDGIIPSPNEYGSILKRLHQVAQPPIHHENSCILVNRTQVSGEDMDEDDTEYSTEIGFSDQDFLTLRWDMGHSLKNPKGMIHTGKVPVQYFEQMDALNNLTAHNIAPGRECRNDRPYFRLYHYPGSDEQQRFQDDIDPRGPAATRIGGSRPLYERKKIKLPVRHIQPWIQGFIQQVGKSHAKRLLDGVGQLQIWKPYKKEQSSTVTTNQ